MSLMVLLFKIQCNYACKVFNHCSMFPFFYVVNAFIDFIVVFSVSWEPSSNRRIKQVSGHLYATLLDKLRPFTQYKARIKATNDPSNVIAVRDFLKLEIALV